MAAAAIGVYHVTPESALRPHESAWSLAAWSTGAEARRAAARAPRRKRRPPEEAGHRPGGSPHFGGGGRSRYGDLGLEKNPCQVYIRFLCKGFSPRRAGRGQARIMRIIGERDCKACDGREVRGGTRRHTPCPSGLARTRRAAGSPQPGTGFSFSRCFIPAAGGRGSGIQQGRPRPFPFVFGHGTQ